MSIEATQSNIYYSQALHDFLNDRHDHFTDKLMNKWIRKRIRFYEKMKYILL